MSEIKFASTEAKALELWNRPGGKIKSALVAVLFLFVAYRYFPVFVQALDNTAEFAFGFTYATFAIFCAIVSVIFFYTLLTSPKVRAIVTGIWDILMDYTIGMVIQWNPQVLAREQAAENFKEVEKLEDSVDEVAHKEEEIGAQLAENEREIRDIENKQNSWKMLTPEQLQRRNTDPEEIAYEISTLENRKDRIREWSQRLTPVYNDIKNARVALNQLAKYAKFQAQVFSDNVEIKIKEYESMKAANSAAQRFMNILSGNNEKSFMGQKALMYMQAEMTKNSAEFKQVLRRSKDFVKSINLQEAVYDKAALDYLNEYKRQYEKQLVDKSVQNVVPVSSVAVQTNTNYNNLIN